MRDKRERGWFWLDNAIVDRTDLNIYEKMLYMCLARHSGEKDYCFPSLETLCKELGIKDTRTVVKYIRSLENKNLVEIEKIKGRSNRYYINNVKLPTSDVPTYNVPTFDVPPTSDDTTLPTSDVPSSTHMGCTSKKTNIKKTKEKDTTTKIDNINYIDPENLQEEEKDSSSSSFDLIKQMLEQHGISNNTKMNIMVLVRDENITVERVAEVLKASQIKHWQEGAIYTALRDNWNTNLEAEQQEKEKQREKSAKIDKKIQEDRDKYAQQKEKAEQDRNLKDELQEFYCSLSPDIQNKIKKNAEVRSKEKYGAIAWKSMLNISVIYEVIKEYKTGVLNL